MTSPTLSAGKTLSRHGRGLNSTTLVLNYPRADAQSLRRAAESIRLKGNRPPSMALIARRSLAVYLQILEDPRYRNQEIAALEMLATPLATRVKQPES